MLPGAESLEDIPSLPEWEYRVNRTDFPNFFKNSFSGRESNERPLSQPLQLFQTALVKPTTVEPRFNDLRYNDIPSITINNLLPAQQKLL